MSIVAYPKSEPIPAPASYRCPAGCDLSQTIRCWLGRRRELLADLRRAEAANSVDAEVLRADLRVADIIIDVLLEFGRLREGLA